MFKLSGSVHLNWQQTKTNLLDKGAAHAVEHIRRDHICSASGQSGSRVARLPRVEDMNGRCRVGGPCRDIIAGTERVQDNYLLGLRLGQHAAGKCVGIGGSDILLHLEQVKW